jgi:hypothetical protein
VSWSAPPYWRGGLVRLAIVAGVEHRLGTTLRPLHAHGRRVRRRRFHEAGEQRGFGHADICGVLAKISTRGGFDAVQPIAEIHLVEVELEDLLLRVEALET